MFAVQTAVVDQIADKAGGMLACFFLGQVNRQVPCIDVADEIRRDTSDEV